MGGSPSKVCDKYYIAFAILQRYILIHSLHSIIGQKKPPPILKTNVNLVCVQTLLCDLFCKVFGGKSLINLYKFDYVSTIQSTRNKSPLRRPYLYLVFTQTSVNQGFTNCNKPVELTACSRFVAFLAVKSRNIDRYTFLFVV